MSNDRKELQPGCYYPGCPDEHTLMSKFCLEHIHTPKAGDKEVSKTTTNKKAAPKKAGKKAAPKKAGKKAAPKKAGKRKKPVKKGAGVGNGTPAQKKAAAAAKGYAQIDWRAEVERFRKAKAKNMRLEMSTPGSAQVTRVRLTQSDYCKGLTISTKGCEIFFKKGK